MSRCLLLAGTLGCLGLSAGWSAQERDKSIVETEEKLRGTWVVHFAEIDGRELPAAGFKDVRLTYSEGKVKSETKGKTVVTIWKIAARKDRIYHIDQTALDGIEKGMTRAGILEFIDADTFRICAVYAGAPANTQRPTKFETKPESNYSIIVFKRVLRDAKPPLNDATKDEIKKLQGAWQVTKFVDHGLEAAPPEELKDHIWEFNGDKFTQRKGKDGFGRPGTLTLDVSKKPKWIDLDLGTADFPLPSEGIYKLEGDELSLCVVGGTRGDKPTPRPTEFKASKNPPHSLLILKKIKK